MQLQVSDCTALSSADGITAVTSALETIVEVLEVFPV